MRRLGPADVAACHRLDQASLGGLWSEAQWATELAEPNRPCLGLWRGEELRALACGWLILEELHISVVAVDPRHRRCGLGRQVLQNLLAEAARRGAERATLEVGSGNTAARALYAALGFREAGIRRGYYRNGEDALIEWLNLSAPAGPTP
ncbi:MAG: GNAT family N-acetyltransferase [Synechococcus sp.]